MTLRDRLYLDVESERLRQEDLWGVQHHEPLKWLSILHEETGEIAKAINENDDAGLRAEVLESLAVCLAWLEDIDSEPPSSYWDDLKRRWVKS